VATKASIASNQLAALRRLRAAFGFVEVIEVELQSAVAWRHTMVT
jgi:hypothetical protein